MHAADAVRWRFIYPAVLALLTCVACSNHPTIETRNMKQPSPTASQILGNADYRAISYGGYRDTSRHIQPTLEMLKEDLRLLHAMDIRLLRTYNVQLPHAGNVLRAIREMKAENPAFEMYVMLGAWIDALNAWTGLEVDHHRESPGNAAEIERAVALAKEYPDIVKIIAVGNESMVKWATAYYVQPGVILKWVRHLQSLKAQGLIHDQIWITSSDNFASWGGDGDEYHVSELDSLIAAVDYVSMHTYPMHDTHYNPTFWGTAAEEEDLGAAAQVQRVMGRAKEYAVGQYEAVERYVARIDATKPIHIGETGWASASDGFYGPAGSRACDEYKQSLYYQDLREWTDNAGITCFYFEAFDEPWKDAGKPRGSENFFGLFTVDGRAKHALWPYVDAGAFEGLTRGGHPITKTFGGDSAALMQTVALPEPIPE